MKPTDKAVFRMVSELPGRNESKQKKEGRRPSSSVRGENSMAWRGLTECDMTPRPITG